MYSVEKILEQEKSVTFKSFTAEDALELGNLIVKRGIELNTGRGFCVHIEKCDLPLFTHFCEGTSVDNIDWVNGKKSLVKRYMHSSLYCFYKEKELEFKFHEKYFLDESEYRISGGSVPLVVDGAGCIGSITVSGLAHHDDHELVINSILEFKQKR